MDQNREAAYKILLSIETKDQFSNLEILNYLKNHEVESPDFVRRLVYGVLERRLYLDYFLDKIIAKGIESADPKAKIILRMGIYQLEFMDSVPDYAAINSSVQLAKKYAKGRDSFVNGVLRGWQRKSSELDLPPRDEDEISHLAVKYSCHKDVIAILMEDYGIEACEGILEYMWNIPQLAVRINLSKMDNNIEGLELEPSHLSERSFIVKNNSGNITDLDQYENGGFSIQSQESTWVADGVRACPGERVLDMCAAPGGKTLAISEKMENNGEVLACDIYPQKLDIINTNAKRLGIEIINTKVMDGTEASHPDDWIEGFDWVLIDGPCTGLGVMNRKPEIRYRKLEVVALSEIQRNLLKNGSDFVRYGGCLVYSTCTLTKRENSQQIQDFLSKNLEYTLVEETQLLPHIDGCDGFYRAIMRRERR